VEARSPARRLPAAGSADYRRQLSGQHALSPVRAVSAARANDPDRAAETLAQARRMDPGQVTAWIGVLTEG